MEEQKRKDEAGQETQGLDSVESVEIAGISEPEAGADPEPTASATDGGQADNLSDEIELRMRGIDAVMISMRRVCKYIEESEQGAPSDPKLAPLGGNIVAIIRQMSAQVENMLPMLRDFADNLEALGEDEKAGHILKSLEEIEDERLPRILAFLESHPVRHDPIKRPPEE